MLLIGIQGQTARDMLRQLLLGASLESYLASSGVPMDDVGVQLAFELFVRSRTHSRGRTRPSSGRRPARPPRCPRSCPCRLMDRMRGVRALFPPPLVLVLPSHVRCRLVCWRAGAPRAWRAGASAARGPHCASRPKPIVLLAGHVVHGSEVRLGAGDLELGDVGAEPGERTGRVELVFELVKLFVFGVFL